MTSEQLTMNIEALNWDKVGGLIPVIVQDSSTLQVLMLGYMNQAALQQSIQTRKITFFSRTKQRLWTKGEVSGNDLSLISAMSDCDNDTLLILAKPAGPSCHLNTTSCFGVGDAPGLGMLAKLESIIAQRYQNRPANSYVTSLFDEGVHRIAQKVGEEGVELALAGVSGSKDDIKNEAADLFFHTLILLKERGVGLDEVVQELAKRHKLY